MCVQCTVKIETIFNIRCRYSTYSTCTVYIYMYPRMYPLIYILFMLPVYIVWVQPCISLASGGWISVFLYQTTNYLESWIEYTGTCTCLTQQRRLISSNTQLLNREDELCMMVMNSSLFTMNQRDFPPFACSVLEWLCTHDSSSIRSNKGQVCLHPASTQTNDHFLHVRVQLIHLKPIRLKTN